MQNQRCRVDQRPNADFSRVHETEVDGNFPPLRQKKTLLAEFCGQRVCV